MNIIKNLFFISLLLTYSTFTFADNINWTPVFINNQTDHWITATIACKPGDLHTLFQIKSHTTKNINVIYCPDKLYVGVYLNYHPDFNHPLCQPTEFPARNGTPYYITIEADHRCSLG